MKRNDFLEILANTKLHFNPAQARKAMEKQRQDRTAKDIELVSKLAADLSFFSQLPMKIIRRCAGCMCLKTFKPNEVVFEQGDPGDAFFVVLSGCLELHVNSEIAAEHHGSQHTSTTQSHFSDQKEHEENLFKTHLVIRALRPVTKKIRRWVEAIRKSRGEKIFQDGKTVGTEIGKGRKRPRNRRGSMSWAGAVPHGRKNYGAAVGIFRAGDAFG